MTNEEQTISNLRKLKSFHNGSYGSDINKAIKALEQQPNMVSRSAYEQVMWERDVAIVQLKELGYGLGEKPKTDWIPVSNPRKELPKDRILWVTISNDSELSVTTWFWDSLGWSEDFTDLVLAYMDYVVPTPYKREE